MLPSKLGIFSKESRLTHRTPCEFPCDSLSDGEEALSVASATGAVFGGTVSVVQGTSVCDGNFPCLSVKRIRRPINIL